jgi:hypothetical protein
MYECHGWTDKFQLFQFSFSSYSRSLSVRTEVRSQKNVTDNTDRKNTDPIGGNIQWQRLNVTDGTIQETCRTINITFSQYAMHAMQCNAMQCNVIQCNAMQCNTQCNVMQCMESVCPKSFLSIQWNLWSQFESGISSVFKFFHFKKYKMTKSYRFRTQDLEMEIWMYGRTDVGMKSFYL